MDPRFFKDLRIRIQAFKFIEIDLKSTRECFFCYSFSCGSRSRWSKKNSDLDLQPCNKGLSWAFSGFFFSFLSLLITDKLKINKEESSKGCVNCQCFVSRNVNKDENVATRARMKKNWTKPPAATYGRIFKFLVSKIGFLGSRNRFQKGNSNTLIDALVTGLLIMRVNLHIFMIKACI